MQGVYLEVETRTLDPTPTLYYTLHPIPKILSTNRLTPNPKLDALLWHGHSQRYTLAP